MDKDHRARIKHAISSNETAKKSYEKLVAKGLKRTDLLEELLSWAVNAREKPAKRYSVSGKSAKTLSYFPTRLKAVADEIAKLNTDPLFIPVETCRGSIAGETCRPCDPSLSGVTTCFTELPEILRHYAEHVRRHGQLLKKRKKGPKPPAHALETLRSFVFRQTGKENLADIKRLLDAVNQDEFDFEAALKTNAHRYPLAKK